MNPTVMQDVAEHYARVGIETSSAKNAIYLLHEKAVYLLTKAIYFEDTRREELDRVQNILAQLQASLIVDDSVGQGLFYVYDHCYKTLQNEDPQSMRNAYVLLASLRSVFKRLLTRP